VTHYRSNVRDIEFNLFEVLDQESILGREPYADLDRETVSAILAEADHLARTKLAETFAIGEHERPRRRRLRVASPANGPVAR